MIGKYLSTLTKEQEDRILVRTLTPYTLGGEVIDSPACLIGAAHGMTRLPGMFTYGIIDPAAERDICAGIGTRFNSLCQRFGVQRVGEAIRSRILTNQLRRSIAQAKAIKELTAA